MVERRKEWVRLHKGVMFMEGRAKTGENVRQIFERGGEAEV